MAHPPPLPEKKIYTQPGPNFMALLTAEFRAYDHDSPAYVQAPNFCASLVSVECLVTLRPHAQKPKFAAYP